MGRPLLWKPTRQTARSFQNLSVFYGGRAGGVLAEHAHPEVQVSVRFHSNGEQVVQASHVTLNASLQPHAAHWEPGSETVVFLIAPDLLLEARQEIARGIDFDIIPAHRTRDAALEGLGLIVRQEFQTAERLSGFYIESIGHIVARHLLRSHAIVPIDGLPSNGLTEEELRRLRAFIRERLQRGFSVGELAESLHLGPSRFAEKLRLATGLSPWNFVRAYRIGIAKSLLRNKMLSIAEIAQELGFADQSHLTNSFRTATSMTPKRYRSHIA